MFNFCLWFYILSYVFLFKDWTFIIICLGVGKAVSSSGGIFGGGSSLTTTPSSGAGIFGGVALSTSTTSASSGMLS